MTDARKLRLSPEDWIKAGFRALTTGGPAAIRVEPLARELKATKGSFYWHFADLPALRRAIIDHWRRAATTDIVHIVEAVSPDAGQRLLTLARHAGEAPPGDVGGRRVEPAIRDWGRYDDDVAATIHAVDAERLAFVSRLFRDLGYAKADAAERARLFYAGYVGLSHMGGGADLSERQLLVFVDLLIRDRPK